MRLRERVARVASWQAAGLLLTALLTLSCIALVALSGSGRLPFAYANPEPVILDPDSAIGGSLTFDRGSYLAGEPIRYQLRLLWRDAVVTPNLESLAAGVGFYPFTHRSTKTARRRLGGGVHEIVADFSLQAVSVDMPASYQLDPASVHYSRLGEESGSLHALRLQPPRVYIGEYYPGEITDIELRPLKPRIDDVPGSRRALPALSAFALFATGICLLWSRGRRRFWSGAAAAAEDATCQEARELLTTAYGPAPLAAEIADRLDRIVDALLAPLLAKDRMQREMLPSPAERLRQQPAVLAGGVALLLAAFLMAVLAAVPAAWLAGDIRICARFCKSSRPLPTRLMTAV